MEHLTFILIYKIFLIYIICVETWHEYMTQGNLLVSQVQKKTQTSFTCLLAF